jgi:hypothetical protein
LFAGEGAKVVISNPSVPVGECAAMIRAQGGDAIFVQTDTPTKTTVAAFATKHQGIWSTQHPRE